MRVQTEKLHYIDNIDEENHQRAFGDDSPAVSRSWNVVDIDHSLKMQALNAGFVK